MPVRDSVICSLRSKIRFRYELRFNYGSTRQRLKPGAWVFFTLDRQLDLWLVYSSLVALWRLQPIFRNYFREDAANSRFSKMVGTDALERIKKLKEARKLASTDNSKEVVNERRQNRLQEIQKRKSEVTSIDEVHDKVDDKEKILSYSIADTNEWHEKHLKAKPGVGGFQNFNQMAFATYNKEINNNKIDKDSYEKAKGVQIPDILAHTPSEEQKKALIQSLTENDKRKTTRKRKVDNMDENNVYVNQKNRDFNKKLERQYLSK